MWTRPQTSSKDPKWSQKISNDPKWKCQISRKWEQKNIKAGSVNDKIEIDDKYLDNILHKNTS